MFSAFITKPEAKKFRGIANNRPTCTISITDYIEWIRNNPARVAITFLHSLEKGTDEYKRLKKDFDYITPHGIMGKIRSNDDIARFSGYLYFDIDAVDVTDDTDALRHTLITQYPVCVCGKSIGGRGLFVLVKVNCELTKENFRDVFQYVKEEVLCNISTDSLAEGIHRAQFVPYDPHVYYNENIVVDVPDKIIDKGIISVYNTEYNDDIPSYVIYSDDTLPITTVLSELRFNTQYVDTQGEDYVIQEHEAMRCFIPRIIPDNTKHATFRRIVSQLYFINRYIEQDRLFWLIYSYLFYLNYNQTDGKPMKPTELKYVIETAFNNCLQGRHAKPRIQRVHTNRSLSTADRRRIAIRVVADLRKAETLEKIRIAVSALRSSSNTITQRMVERYLAANGSPVGIATIKRHWKEIQSISQMGRQQNTETEKRLKEKNSDHAITDAFIARRSTS